MSWITDLYQTYETFSDQIAAPRPDGKIPLLPVAHTLARAHVEIELDEDAAVKSMQMLALDEADTIIPCTEDSACRSSNPAPHVLFDTLAYLAGDFTMYINGKDNTEAHGLYMTQLKAWCEDEACPEEVRIIHRYLAKNCLVGDLIQNNILQLGEDGKAAEIWSGDKKNKPIEISKILVRFRVDVGLEIPPLCNQNTALFEAYRRYYLNQKTDRRICYVTGRENGYTEKHPNHLRNGGDNAKLISANDSSGYTYRGRFRQPSEAVTVGYEVSQKAHHALRWLINTQGWKNGEQTILSWGVAGGQYPSLEGDSVDTFGTVMLCDREEFYNAQFSYAKDLKQAVQGYCRKEEQYDETVVVMALEAATPGRLSITYYRQLHGSDFMARVEQWHRTCCWRHSYKSIEDGTDAKGKTVYRRVFYTGAPSPADIVFAAYGPRADDKLKKSTIERILPCIVDGRNLPRDLMRSAVRRASNPVGMESWEWQKTLSIACALIKKFRYDEKREEWDMNLDPENTNRDYLFGRLLAYADNIETLSQYLSGIRHDTIAQKFQSAFEIHPSKTWMIIRRQLKPYLDKIRLSKYGKLFAEMTHVSEKFQEGDFNNSPLNELYLLGYDLQMAEFDRRRNLKNETENKEEVN